MTSPMCSRAWLLLIALSLAWGGSFFFNDVALLELPPLLIVWARVATGAFFLAVMLRLAGLAVGAPTSSWGC